jgi:choline transporter-like protein 2/4/5
LSYTWLAAFIVGCVLLGILLLLILVLIKRIRLAIQLICEASKAITNVILTLFWPLVPLVLQVGFLAYFLTNAVIIACAGKKIFKVANTTNSSANVGDSCNSAGTSNGVQCVFYNYGFDSTSTYTTVIGFLNQNQYVPQLYNLFMLFWVEAFIVGWSQMILAGCFGIWYWSKSKSHCILVTSIKDTCVYHLGSVAFGSLMIAICKFLRFCIELVERRLKSATGLSCFANLLFFRAVFSFFVIHKIKPLDFFYIPEKARNILISI